MVFCARVVVVMGLLAAFPDTACADSAESDSQARESESQARGHYAAGKALYELGNYSDALRELLIGYSIIPKPQFMLNLGQCYRRLDDLPKAKEMFQKYLDSVPPDDRSRPQVQKLLDEINQQLKLRTPSPAPESVTVVATHEAPPETVRPKRRLWWVAIPVVAVAAAGLSVGLYFALKPSCTASLGCFNSESGN